MMYEYKAKMVRAVDGDTAIFDVDVGFGVTMRHRTRLLGINTPERGQDGYEAAKGALFEMCAERQLIVKTHKDKGDKYGRYLAEIAVLSATGEIAVPNVAAKLIADGMGVEYIRHG